jgi:hypothetical protein
MQHSVTVSAGVLRAQAVQLLKYGVLQDQAHKCAAAVQGYQAMHQLM